MRRFVPQAIVLVIFVCLLATSTFAQTGQFTGTVTDPQKASVAGASVRVVQQTTGIERRVKTNDGGVYTAPFLEPGQYRIFVQAQGFETAASTDLTLAPSQSLVFDVQLKVGEALASVTVTGTLKQEEDLQTVPVSATAISGEQLTEQHIDTVSQAAALAPNVNFVTQTGVGAGSNAFVFIRGIGQSEAFIHNDPGVGMYVDGVYLGRTQGGNLRLLDLERVEILRGPQGDLFGRNSIGGAINLITRKPAEKLGGYLDLDLGNETTVNARGRLDFPITHTLFGSIAFAHLDHDGYTKWFKQPACATCTGNNLDNERTNVGRLALRWVPAESVTSDFAFDYSSRRATAVGRHLSVYNAAAEAPPALGYGAAVAKAWNIPSIQSFVIAQPHVNASWNSGRDNEDIWGVSETISANLRKALTLKSITAFRGLDTYVSGDADGSPMQLNSLIQSPTQQYQFSEEVQLLGSVFDKKLDWLLGGFGYLEHADQSVEQGVNFAEAPSFAFVPNPGGPPSLIPTDTLNNATGLPGPDGIRDCFRTTDPWRSCGTGTQFNKLDTYSLATFGHAIFHITSRFSISGGLRYSFEHKIFDFRSTPAIDPVHNVRLSPPFAPFHLEHGWHSVTPRVGVEYQASNELLVYGSYSKGFKSGTFNNGTTGSRFVEPEKANSYEFGVKSDWFSKRLRMNVAGFYTDYKNQQLQVAVPPFDFAFSNVASSSIKGGEFELAAWPHQKISLELGAGYTDARIKDVGNSLLTPFPLVGVNKGGRLPYVPRWDLKAAVNFHTVIGNRGLFRVRVDTKYISAQEGDLQNTPFSRTGAYGLANAMLAYAPVSNVWELSFWGRNLLDRGYETARFASQFGAGNLFVISVDGAPRTFGVSFRVSFSEWFRAH